MATPSLIYRCFVGYQPTIGEQQGLGCQASDTCMDDDGSLRACAACESSGYVERFGCDTLTKLCRFIALETPPSVCSPAQRTYQP